MDAHATARSAAQASATLLREQARFHKRTASHHRREAQRIMSSLSDIQRSCLAVGIIIDIDSPEAPSHGQRRTSS